MLLNNVLYISYIVPVERVLPLVPGGLPLALVDNNKAFISVVIIRCKDVHIEHIPFPRFDYYQLNVRTYVIDPHTGKKAVYFIRSGVTSFPVSTATRVFGLSWQHIRLIVNTQNESDRTMSSYVVAGEWEGEIALHAKSNVSDTIDMSPFVSVEGAVTYLVRPLIGFYRWGGSISRFEIRHPEVYPQTMYLEEFKFPFLIENNFLRSDELLKPHSVLLVPDARFSIYLPPERLKSKYTKIKPKL